MSANGDSGKGVELADGGQVEAAAESLAMFESKDCGEGMSPASRAKDEEQALRDIVASRLVKARRAAGLKDLEVAKRLGHSNLTMISLFENGHRSPSLRNLQLLADLYSVTTDYLLGRTDSLGLAPEEGNQALITGVLTAVLSKYNQRYLEGLAQVTAISVEGASMDRVLLGKVADISIELSASLAVIRKHHGAAFEELRGGGKLERLISELSVSVKERIASKQRESALIEFDHPVCTVQQVSEAVQQALF
ncbi:helix-turn-helix transcriptional regulator (plasmid) [Pseudomonas fluorescens]|nr:helix-turn-helix transcriptional regulator [Pseudomonas fluorescens]